jgi:hypothetical protein
MARLWHGLSARSGDVVAALLIALLTSGWFLASRPAPGATSTASASRNPQSALAVASETPTAAASLSPNPEATPGPTSAPGVTPSTGALPQPTGGTTAGPGQSQTPPPGKTAGPKPTPTPQALPDLLAVDYGLGDAALVCGGENTSYVTVQNAGKAAAPADTAVLFQLLQGKDEIWAERQTIKEAIPPGGSYSLRAVFKVADPCPADLSLTWSIDPANAVLESKEDNNSAAVSIKSASG